MIKYKINLNSKVSNLSKSEKEAFIKLLENGKAIKEGKREIYKGLFIEVEKHGEDYIIKDIHKYRPMSHLIGALAFLLLSIGVFIYILFLILNTGDGNKPPENIDSVLSGFIYTGGTISGENIITVESFNDYQKYLELSQKSIIKVISPSNPVYSKFDPSDSIGNREKVEKIRNNYAKNIINPKDIVGSGYLYVIASVNNQTLSAKESVYIYLGDFGGHLKKQDSLNVPLSDGKLHLLYPLDKVTFAELPDRGYDDNKEMKSINKDRKELFNKNDNNLYFFGFVSTSRQGKLEEVTIVYK